MTKLSDVLNINELREEIRAGYVTERRHPEFAELAIFNYSAACQYENRWNEVTRVTRGLIVNTDTGRVIARGFPKFFNYGDELNTGPLSPDTSIMGVYDKLDGSLGIQYQTPDGRQAIATRGSFVSDQALHATEWLHEVAAYNHPESMLTMLWEIVYPENRIVVDYSGRDECISLGAVRVDTGSYVAPSPLKCAERGLAHAEAFPGRTLGDALALPPRSNAEGVVVWFNPWTAVKVKQADYVELHRIVSNLTEKEVWRQLRAGTFEKYAADLPDEFHQWARDTARPLTDKFDEIDAEAVEIYQEVLRLMLPDRKSQAQWIITNAPVEYRGFVFGHLDGKNPTDGIWKLIEPRGE